MNSYISVATISSPEFINLQPLDINPLMSKCEIKVLYLGENRNGSYISKDVATEMSKTLRGAPIVGYYRKDKEDFFDHGDKVTIDGDGIRFESLTQPYGFVSPDAKVWFQDFKESKPTGEEIIRTYLMTTGYLWTGQYEEAQQILDDGGKPQSMELDKDTLSGHWATRDNSFMEFFIINDAIFSKLCALGDAVEPCFEGSSITAPNVSSSFALDKKFTSTLFSMMKELQEALQGGNGTVDENTQVLDSQEVADASVAEEQATEQSVTEQAAQEPEAAPAAEFNKNLDNDVQDNNNENQVNIGEENLSTDFEKKDEEEEDSSEDNKDTETEDKKDEEEKEDEDKKKYALLQTEFENLQAKCADLEKEVTELREFKANVEDKEKDSLIAEFYMLSDEDKKEIVENKSSYTLDEIKSKLAVICYDKKINYSNENTDNKLAEATLNITPVDSSTPEWLQAVERHSNR